MRGGRSRGWRGEGFDRIGILGTSLGSCLVAADDGARTADQARRRSTTSRRISPTSCGAGSRRGTCGEGLDGHIELDLLRALWKPISPRWYLERLRDRQTLLVYARYDLTFPVDLSEDLVREFRDRGIPHEVAVLRAATTAPGRRRSSSSTAGC